MLTSLDVGAGPVLTRKSKVVSSYVHKVGPPLESVQLVNQENHRKNRGKPEENGGLMWFCGIYPLVICYIANWKITM